MGAGSATTLVKQFGGVGELKSQLVDVGGVDIIQGNGRFVYYLVTKRTWRKTYPLGVESATVGYESSHCTAQGQAPSHATPWLWP